MATKRAGDWAAIAAILTMTIAASPLNRSQAETAFAESPFQFVQPQHPDVGSDPTVPVFSPHLQRVRVIQMDSLMPLKVVPWDFDLIPRIHPLTPDLSKAHCVVERNGILLNAACIWADYWGNNLIADCNDDLIVDAADIQYLLDHLYRNGPPPIPDFEYPRARRSDFNCDGAIDMQDMISTIYYRHGFANPRVPMNPDRLREQLRADSLGLN